MVGRYTKEKKTNVIKNETFKHLKHDYVVASHSHLYDIVKCVFNFNTEFIINQIHGS
jgi:hypothetical protein